MQEKSLFVPVPIEERQPPQFNSIHIVLLGGVLPMIAQYRPSRTITDPPTGEWWNLTKGEPKLFDENSQPTHWCEFRLERTYLAEKLKELMEADDKANAREPQIGNVYQTSLGAKIVIRSQHQINTIKANAGDYTFICEEAHGDGDFSYRCGSEHCRCTQ